jgi:TP901-1 family phage major tail protein
MKIFKGSKMLLKILIDNKYETIGGMRVTRLNLSNQLIDITSKDSENWRELAENAGLQNLSILGSGIFTANLAEELIATAAFSNKIYNYQLTSESGDTIEGKFFIVSYERSGNIFEEEAYSIALESSGKVKFYNQNK